MEKVHERATRTKTSGKAALGMEEKFRRRERLEEGRGIVRAKLERRVGHSFCQPQRKSQNS